MSSVAGSLRSLVPVFSAFALVLSCASSDDDEADAIPDGGGGGGGAKPSGGRAPTPGAGGADGGEGADGFAGNAGNSAGSGGVAGDDARGETGAGGFRGLGGTTTGGQGYGGRVTYDSVCGNSIREGIEQCDSGQAAGKDGCSAACTLQACDVCLAGICGGLITHFECRRYGAPDDELGRAQCAEILDCMHVSGCAAEDGNPSRCFCGDAFDAGAGGAGTDFELWCSGVLDDREANGACRGVIERILGTTNRRDVAAQLRNPMNPVGYAMLGIACETDVCVDACSVASGAEGTGGIPGTGGYVGLGGTAFGLGGLSGKGGTFGGLGGVSAAGSQGLGGLNGASGFRSSGGLSGNGGHGGGTALGGSSGNGGKGGAGGGLSGKGGALGGISGAAGLGGGVSGGGRVSGSGGASGTSGGSSASAGLGIGAAN